ALATIDASDTRIGGLLAELTSSAIVSATGSQWELVNPTTKAWILATDVRTTAAVLDALVRLRPDHPLIPSTIRWLMAARNSDHGYWPTTHDTAQALLALTDFLSTSGELNADYQWQLAVNNQPLDSGAFNRASLADPASRTVVPLPQLHVGSNAVDLTRSVGGGRMYYTLQLRSFTRADDMPFVSQGFTVGREYLPY